MVRLPWRGGDDEDDRDEARDDESEESLVSCSFQDGSLSVYEGRVQIERSSSSNFESKSIPTDEVRDVSYSGGRIIGYLQIEQTGIDPADGGRFSAPVDENTLHFGYGSRDCAQKARDRIFEQMEADGAADTTGDWS
jgi:hypothetical protein